MPSNWRVGGMTRAVPSPLSISLPAMISIPAVADLPGIELITLDSVHFAAPPADAEALRLAGALVRQAARSFEKQEGLRVVDTAIVALRGHVHQVLEAKWSAS